MGTGGSSTALTGPEIIEHYASQMEEAGWVRAEGGVSPEAYAENRARVHSPIITLAFVIRNR